MIKPGDKVDEFEAKQTDTFVNEKSSEILVKVKQELESILEYLHKH